MIKKFLSRLTVLSLLVLLVHSPVWAGTAVDYDDPNCQGAWLMDTDVGAGALPDSSQNSNTGQVKENGEPDYATASPPDTFSIGYYDWDGLDDRVVITDHTSLRISPNITIIGWVRPTATPVWALLWSDWYDHNTQAIHYGLNQGKLSLYISSSGSDADGIVADTALTEDVWEHGATTFEGGTVNIYKGGSTDMTEDTFSVTSIYNSVRDKWLGCKNESGSAVYPFPGDLDEFAIFDRVLDSTEINDIMDNGLAPAVTAKNADGEFFWIF